MYRALIVEDEALMREYLAARLADICPDWEAAATAQDGIEAAAILSHDRFDAVLTDIRMPGMDGLELARFIRQADPELPILIISGYNEFEYARASMRLNVFDYLLKPLNEEELSAALSAIAVQAQARHGKANDQLLSSALSGSREAAQTLAEKAKGKACGLLVLAPSLAMKPCQRNTALDQLKAAVQSGVSPLCARLSRMVAVLCASEDPLLVERDCRAAVRLMHEHHLQLRARCGYVPFDYAAPNTSLGAAQEELDLALALDEPSLPHPLQYAHFQAKGKLAAMKEELHKALSSGAAAEETSVWLQGLLREFNPEARLTVLMGLLDDLEADGDLRSAVLDLHAEREQEGDAPAVRFVVERLFTRGKTSGKQVSALVRQALDYLQLHFCEPISLSFLAEQLCITPAYLSTLFHREMGLSYSRCLLKLRMDDACRRLLADADVRIHEVGEAVGFPSSKHFSHVFGQYFHMTPKEYRENKRR